MSIIDNLNNQYTEKLKRIGFLKESLRKINQELHNAKLSSSEIAFNLMLHLQDLSKKIDCSNYIVLSNVIPIFIQYFNCSKAIEDYQNALLKTKGKELSEAIENVERTQALFTQAKNEFREKFGYNVDSVTALNKIIPRLLEEAISSEETDLPKLKKEAKAIVDREYTTELKMTDPILSPDVLPKSMLVARYPFQSISHAILKDVGVVSAFKSILIDLYNNGNILVKTDFKQINDEQIDSFITSFILRFIEAFPLGSVRVHIFDKNAKYIFMRLKNSFQDENDGEIVKSTINIHNSLGDLSTFRTVICEDIFKKTSVDVPDLYSVYNTDKSDSFNLVIIRNGLVDEGGYASPEILNEIALLTKPDDIGHKCGLRFLIVDDSDSFAKNLSDANLHIITTIHNNCELKALFENGNFIIDGKKADVLHSKGKLDVFVQERSRLITDAINKREKNIVSINDVSANSIEEEIANIMYIPVGKSGDKIVELPFSCKDEGETVAGQCIGYIAIGQSGSGKSSFFHSIVLNGCMKYSPRDLQFWLLDFKNGGASSKYSRCGMPHIRIIAENNKIDDALCLFQMVLEEMERRNKAFNKVFTDNIVEYNQKAVADDRLEYFPRIIIAIDEVQEIFREDNSSVIQKLISSISSRMRSAGMHFVMIAQNLTDGKSYMLKEAFLPSATGRICFRVAEDIPRDSGFENEFIDRKHEISELKTGEAYVSYGKNTIKKVKMAFVSSQEMNDIFGSICNRFPEYAEMRPLVIGSKARLSVMDYRQGTTESYLDILRDTTSKDVVYQSVIGEDVYRMSPLTIRFSQYENSSVLFLGNDKMIASSMCTSIVISLIRQKATLHLFNGDRIKAMKDEGALPHPFMYVCQNVISDSFDVNNHSLAQLKGVLSELYGIYLERQMEVQQAEYEDPIFSPIFLVINDLFGIESFVSNEIIEKSNCKSEIADNQVMNPFNFSIEEIDSPATNAPDSFREGVQNIMNAFIKNGYRYGIHVVLSIKGDPSVWRSLRISSDINNIILFNDTEYADECDNSYFLKEMLRNVSNDTEEETLAVWYRKKALSKIRPIIYDLSQQREKEAIDSLLKEVNDETTL